VARPHLRDPKLERFWRTHIDRWATSGLNIRDYCARHGLTEPSFYAWRRELAARDREAVAATPAPPTRPTTPSRRTPVPSRPAFVPVRVVPDRPLELVLRSGHTLRVPPGYDASHLRAVADALEAGRC
jgi:hypothetical protein